MLPVILLGAISSDSPEEKGRRVMSLISEKFDKAYKNCEFSLLLTATQEVTDFCRKEYGIEERFMSLQISPFVCKKADGDWVYLSDSESSESSDTQGFRECHLVTTNPAAPHWVLIFFVRQECFREIQKKCQRIQRKFSCRRTLEKKVNFSFLLSSFFSFCDPNSVL